MATKPRADRSRPLVNTYFFIGYLRFPRDRLRRVAVDVSSRLAWRRCDEAAAGVSLHHVAVVVAHWLNGEDHVSGVFLLRVAVELPAAPDVHPHAIHGAAALLLDISVEPPGSPDLDLHAP